MWIGPQRDSIHKGSQYLLWTARRYKASKTAIPCSVLLALLLSRQLLVKRWRHQKREHNFKSAEWVVSTRRRPLKTRSTSTIHSSFELLSVLLTTAAEYAELQKHTLKSSPPTHCEPNHFSLWSTFRASHQCFSACPAITAEHSAHRKLLKTLHRHLHHLLQAHHKCFKICHSPGQTCLSSDQLVAAVPRVCTSWQHLDIASFQEFRLFLIYL